MYPKVCWGWHYNSEVQILDFNTVSIYCCNIHRYDGSSTLGLSLLVKNAVFFVWLDYFHSTVELYATIKCTTSCVFTLCYNSARYIACKIPRLLIIWSMIWVAVRVWEACGQFMIKITGNQTSYLWPRFQLGLFQETSIRQAKCLLTKRLV